MNTNRPRILVTGGTGFLGRHVVWRLASLGYDVIFTGRKQNEADIVCALSEQPSTFVLLDHQREDSRELLLKACRDCQAIIHIAALSSPWGRKEDFTTINVQATQDVVDSCTANHIPRLVHISTPSVYFDFTNRQGIKETSPLPSPVNDYAATKAEAEKIALASGLSDVVILRPRALFGPWDQTLMPRLLRFLNRGFLPVPRRGQALIDITYIDNAVDAIILALQKNTNSIPSIYNVSNGTPVSVRTLLHHTRKAFDLKALLLPIPYHVLDGAARWMEGQAKRHPEKGEPLLTRYTAGVLAFDQTLNLSAIQTELGYAPKIGWQEGIERYATWYKEQPNR